MRVADRELQLDPGDIVTLEPGLVHGASAVADSAFLMIRADTRAPASQSLPCSEIPQTP